MRITIVTISFNQAKFLKQCIDSVLQQEECDLEYIVVDPGSTDGSREIIESYGDKLIKIFEPDEGPSDGLNHGFARAAGEIFGFINADDYLLRGALSAVNHHFATQELDHFVSGSGFIHRFNQAPHRIQPTRMTKLNYIYGACTVFQQGTFFPAWMFRKVGGFNVRNRTCWDGELFVSFLDAGYRHDLLDCNLAVFHIHEASISGSGRLEMTYYQDTQRIFQDKMGRRMNLFDCGFSYLLRAIKLLKRIYQ